MWSNSFAGVNTDNKVLVLKAWADFFIQHMMEPCTFEWAENFFCSGAPLSLMDKDTETVPLAITKKCPTIIKHTEDHLESQGPMKNKKIVLVDTELRRSTRLCEKPGGLKQFGNLHRGCSSCVAPHINPRTNKRLGAEFCKVDKDMCSPEALATTKPPLGVI